jgi:hypothetical protein
MTQIGVGIGVSKSPAKIPVNKQNHKIDPIKSPNENSQTSLRRKILVNQISNNSSDPRPTNDGGDEDNSNSFESHSDLDLTTPHEKKLHLINNKLSQNIRRGMSVNWGSNSTSAINLTSTRNPGQFNQNVKSFAHSLYRNPIRLTGLTSSSPKTKSKQTINSSQQPSIILTPIPSEPELALCRVYPPPQPRPESLAIMSDALFHERLKARLTPLCPAMDLSQPPSLVVDHCSTPKFSSTSSLLIDKSPTEDINQSIQTLTHEKQDENLIEINSSSPPSPPPPPIPHAQLTVQQIINNIDDSSDESWRLLNSNSSLDIPYIDESDFEDLGKLIKIILNIIHHYDSIFRLYLTSSLRSTQ